MKHTFKDSICITDESISTYFSLGTPTFIVGGMIGALFRGWVEEKLGRKQGLLERLIFYLLGSALMDWSKAASNYEMLLIGRTFVGISVGLSWGLSPLYVAEIATTNIRGAMGTLSQFALSVGILTSMVLGLEEALGGDDTWSVS